MLGRRVEEKRDNKEEVRELTNATGRNASIVLQVRNNGHI
jgi:hypothetical protein